MLLIYCRLLDIIFIDTSDLYKKITIEKLINRYTNFYCFLAFSISALLAIRLAENHTVKALFLKN